MTKLADWLLEKIHFAAVWLTVGPRHKDTHYNCTNCEMWGLHDYCFEKRD